ncbi:CoA transferase [Gemmatimonas sp.]|uniref:CoA transferase n=1 Tax=Gemmatimonas sp. TaxID=1962908 RepID=UPI0025B8E0D7|nr:CoA transferase [Gemmatimonas sp.]MCA2985437.1 CoA transferase [Gemmatimonas sp.]MCA2986553.1 CoA transferase [Gemmatimonas sp.]MCA2993918.1 CoA transferase [Gemmatimonas sp.]
MSPDSAATSSPTGVLAGIRIVSLALNLPGPAALMRLAAMGATCVKVEPPSHDGTPGDPMAAYAPAGYSAMHRCVTRTVLDLKSDSGRRGLDEMLGDANVLLTSFRPSALQRLGVERAPLHDRFPTLSLVTIVGEHGARAEHPGHDLTYEAEAGLLPDLALPVVPFADMAGALLVVEAVLRVVLARQRTPGALLFEEVALGDAARFLALPRSWGLMQATSPIGGAHAGYQVYACRDGRVAVAALEPRFARALCRATGLPDAYAERLQAPTAFAFLAAYFAERTCREVEAVGQQYDLPVAVMP